jgi:hypothetical protein
MPSHKIKTFFMIGATVAAISVAIPQAQATDAHLIVVDWTHQLDRLEIDECNARAESVLENSKPVFDHCVEELSHRPETPAQYKSRTGYDYGARAEDGGTSLMSIAARGTPAIKIRQVASHVKPRSGICHRAI